MGRTLGPRAVEWFPLGRDREEQSHQEECLAPTPPWLENSWHNLSPGAAPPFLSHLLLGQSAPHVGLGLLERLGRQARDMD